LAFLGAEIACGDAVLLREHTPNVVVEATSKARAAWLSVTDYLKPLVVGAL
jgi:hypothetical protein